MPKKSGQIQETEQQSTPYIYFLSNAMHWNISTALIIKFQDHYKLMLDYRSPAPKKIRYIDEYSTVGGARIAFFKYFKKQHFSYDAQKKKMAYSERPCWTHAYQPDENWLRSKFPELLLNKH